MSTREHQSLRFLVACRECKRQYDATRLKAGSRFRCLCGQTVKVPRPESHEADVVRCSSCGAPRTPGTRDCSHCGAGFTLHEQDLQTICPECMTRVGDHARYCHHCATELSPVGQAGTRSELPCPACGPRKRLNSRPLGEPAVAVMECPSCAGLWLDNHAFEALLQRRQIEAVSPGQLFIAPAARPAPGPDSPPAPIYRGCPDCGELMNRRNYGLKSGVIIDSCREHGIWFDVEELERVVQWIRSGGGSAPASPEVKAERVKQALRVPKRIETDRVFGEGLMTDLVEFVIGSLFRPL